MTPEQKQARIEAARAVNYERGIKGLIVRIKAREQYLTEDTRRALRELADSR